MDDFARRTAQALTESGKPFIAASGMDAAAVAKINRHVTEHLSNLLAVQSQVRPGKVADLSKLNVRWEDFGTSRVEAYMDHETHTITLNPAMFMNKDARETKDGRVLRTVTHEFAHHLDRTVGDGQAAFTGLFEPLHGFLTSYSKTFGSPQWMMTSKLAYPLSGYFGMAGKYTENLGMEYISVLSELYWHDPGMLDSLDRHFKEVGYPGPPLRQIMDRTWGTTMPATNMRLPETETRQINPADYGIRSHKGPVRWEPGNSRADPLKRLVN